MLIRKSLAKDPVAQRGPLDVVLVNDPAIDRVSTEGREALTRYAQERDPSVLVLLPAQRPTRFVVRPLPHEAMVHVEAQRDPHVRRLFAFALALETIADLDGGLEGDLSLRHTTIDLGGAKLRALTDDSSKLVAEELGELVVDEIGAVVLQRAQLSAHQKKAFSLPPGCEVRWDGSTAATDPTTPTPAAAT